MERALQVFSLDPENWGVNVQSYSGSPANFSAYTALINPGDRIMGLDLYSGGHLTHGFQTDTKKISATSLYFKSQSYKISEETGYIEYDVLEKNAKEFRPNILIVGGSAYPRDYDYKRFREIADSVGAYLLADISHISGLVATKMLKNPFEYADVVTTTTHKTLRGPRSGMIFSNKKRHPNLDEKIDFAVFPMLQGGPHNHQIGALATQLKEVQTPEFKEYIIQTLKNAKTLSEELMKKGNKLITNGTDNHSMLWDLRPLGLTGSKYEKVCEKVHISLNKNTIIGDKS